METFKRLIRGLGAAISFVLKVTNMFIAAVVLIVAALFLYGAVTGGSAGDSTPASPPAHKYNERPAPVQITPADQLDIHTGTTDPTLNADQRRDRMLRSVVLVSTDKGLGSGVVVDNQQCLVVTNAHVAGMNGELHVDAISRFRDNGEAVTRRIDVEIVGRPSEDDDLALLKLSECDNLPWAPLADSNQLRAGDTVVAIGHPRGLTWSVSAGIVSNPARVFGNYSDVSGFPLVQTDAAINPGNSGGGLFLPDGHLVGINSMILRESDNLGFARSSNLVGAYMGRLAADGRVAPRVLGITLSERDEGQPGLKLDTVADDGLAASSGLEVGDVILAADGHTVDGVGSLKRLVYTDVDGAVTLRVVRDGRQFDLTVRFPRPEHD